MTSHRRAVAYLAPGEALPDGLVVVATVDEPEPARRPRLRDALELIASKQADTLWVPRLSLVAHSLRELVDLLAWLEQAGAELIAADVDLDTAERSVLALLTEIQRWHREPPGGGRGRGRPGIAAGSPEVARRIGELRESGLSLNAIAARLNAEGIPTPRGGSEWRPSSVQAALGYRRPRPPGPGPPLPKPPPPPPSHRPPPPPPGHRPPPRRPEPRP